MYVTCRLQQLEKFSEVVTHAHSLYSGKPVSTHLYDPINAFQLVNRYANKWMKLQDHVYIDNSKGTIFTIVIIYHMSILFFAELMANVSLNNYRLPSREDFSGAVAALQRLQETYMLSTPALASGEVGQAPSVPLTGEVAQD